MHISIRTDPSFEHRRAGAGSSDDFVRSERGLVTLNNVEKRAVAQDFLPPGLKAEGLTLVFQDRPGDAIEPGARLFLRGQDGRMEILRFGQATDGLPSRFAYGEIPVSRGAVEALRESLDETTRDAVSQMLAWLDENAG